jgi:hypothetical protein
MQPIITSHSGTLKILRDAPMPSKPLQTEKMAIAIHRLQPQLIVKTAEQTRTRYLVCGNEVPGLAVETSPQCAPPSFSRLVCPLARKFGSQTKSLQEDTVCFQPLLEPVRLRKPPMTEGVPGLASYAMRGLVEETLASNASIIAWTLSAKG